MSSFRLKKTKFRSIDLTCCRSTQPLRIWNSCHTSVNIWYSVIIPEGSDDSLHSACAVRGSFAKFRIAERDKRYYWRVFSLFNVKNEKQMRQDRNINLKFTIMKLKCRKWRHNVKSFEVKKGHFIKSHHKWKQIIAIVTPFICIFEKTFVVNFDPFLPFSLSTSRISIVLSHLLFILNVK